MLFRTLLVSIAVVGGWGALMCNGKVPLGGFACKNGMAMPPILPVDAVTYVSMAAAGDQFEIQSSQVALRKSQSLDIRNFAQMLINEHSLMSAKLMAAAAQSDLVSPMVMLSPDQQKMLSELEAATFDFDRVFLQKQIIAHQMALALHSNYAAMGYSCLACCCSGCSA